MNSKRMLSIALSSLMSLNSFAGAVPRVKNVKEMENLKGKNLTVNPRLSAKRRSVAKRGLATKINPRSNDKRKLLAKGGLAIKMDPKRRILGLKSANLVRNFRNVKRKPAIANAASVGGRRVPNWTFYGTAGTLGTGVTIGSGIVIGKKLHGSSKKTGQLLENVEEISYASTDVSSVGSENSSSSDIKMVQYGNQVPENEVKSSLDSMDVENANEENNEFPGNVSNFSMSTAQEMYQAPKGENLHVFNGPNVEENVYQQVEGEVPYVNEQHEVTAVKKLEGEEAEKEKTKLLKSIEDNVSLAFYEYKNSKGTKWFPILEQKIGKDKYSCGALVCFIKSNFNGEPEWEDLPVLFDVSGKEHGKMEIYFQKIKSSFCESFGCEAVLFDDFEHPDFEKCKTKLTKGDIGIFQGAVEYKLNKLFEEHGLEYSDDVLYKRLKKFGLGIATKYFVQMGILWRDSRVPLFYDPWSCNYQK